MRIISGFLKGRRFSPPKNFKGRPTTDMAKESLFNVLNNMIDFEGLSVLDLFAGSGSISLEFISRGVNDVTAVELALPHLKFISKTAEEFRVKEQLILRKGNAFSFLSKCKSSYDIIYADPPYGMKELISIPKLVFDNNLLKEDGMLIVEHGPETVWNNIPNFIKTRKYGSVHFSFFYL